MSKMKKYIAFLLALVMCASLMQLPVFAEGNADQGEDPPVTTEPVLGETEPEGQQGNAPGSEDAQTPTEDPMDGSEVEEADDPAVGNDTDPEDERAAAPEVEGDPAPEEKSTEPSQDEATEDESRTEIGSEPTDAPENGGMEGNPEEQSGEEVPDKSTEAAQDKGTEGELGTEPENGPADAPESGSTENEPENQSVQEEPDKSAEESEKDGAGEPEQPTVVPEGENPVTSENSAGEEQPTTGAEVKPAEAPANTGTEGVGQPSVILEGDAAVKIEGGQSTVLHLLTINYTDANNNILQFSTIRSVPEDSRYTVEPPAIEGYPYDHSVGDLTGTMTGDVTITLVYNQDATDPEPTPSSYTLNVQYVDTEGNEIKSAIHNKGQAGAGYNQSKPATIKGYTYDHSVGDQAKGNLNKDVYITHVYTKNADRPALDMSGNGWAYTAADETLRITSTTGFSFYNTLYAAMDSKYVKNVVVDLTKAANITSNNWSGIINLEALESLTIRNAIKVSEPDKPLTSTCFATLIYEDCIELAAHKNLAFTAEDGKLIIKNCTTIDKFAFSAGTSTFTQAKPLPGLTEVEIENVKMISQGAFCSDSLRKVSIALTKPDLKATIQSFSFYNMPDLEVLDLELTGCQEIQTMAFDKTGTPNTEVHLKGFDSKNTKIGISSLFEHLAGGNPFNEKIDVEGLLKDTFHLRELSDPKTLEERTEDYTSSKVGSSDSDTQVTKSAKWTDENRNTAEVAFQFTYDEKPGRDYLFLMDVSKSIGDTASGYEHSRLVNFQSKVIDVADELLNAENFNNRVGLVTFASEAENVKAYDFVGSEGYEDFKQYVLGITRPEDDSTSYVEIFEEALKVINARPDQNREIEIIFLSDGLVGINNGYQSALDALKKTGANIYVVVAGEANASGNNLKSLLGIATKVENADFETYETGDGGYLYYEGTNTNGFSAAMNHAIDAAFTEYVLTDNVDPRFTVDASDIKCDNGYAEVNTNSDGSQTITWHIFGLPFEVFNMSYTATLKDAEVDDSFGELTTNAGPATVYDIGEDEKANAVASPELDRYKVTVRYLDTEDHSKSLHDEEMYVVGDNEDYDVEAKELVLDKLTHEGTDYMYIGPDEDSDELSGTISGANVVVTLLYGRNCTVTYTDGVEDAVVFEDESVLTHVGADTPEFRGSTTREGYIFSGWEPEVAEKVTGDVTYVAQWTPAPYSLTVNYVDTEGNTLQPSTATPYDYNTPYTVTAPAITGYTYDHAEGETTGTILGNVTVTLVYTPNPYTLTVNYVDTEGNTLQPSTTTSYAYNTPYTVPTTSITGYTYDHAEGELTGTILGNVTVTLVYTTNPYTLTVNYVDTAGNTLQPTTTTSYDFNAPYTVTAPAITGYTYDHAEGELTGTILGNVTVTLVYNPSPYTLTVNYVDTAGNTLQPSTTTTHDYNTPYTVTAPAITGYTYDHAEGELTGTILGNVTVTLVYAVNSYTLTVNYVDTAGDTISPSTTQTYANGAAYAVTAPDIAGYRYISASGALTGTVTGDITITLTYATTYTVTVNYVDTAGNTILPTSETDDYIAGDAYSVTVPAIPGYTYQFSAGDDISGVITDDVEITMVYSVTTTTPPSTTPETTPPSTAPETTPPSTAPETTPPSTAPEATPPSTAPETTPPTTTPETTPPSTAPETTPPTTTPETTPPSTPVTPPQTNPEPETPPNPPVVNDQNEPEDNQPNVPPVVDIPEENPPLVDTPEQPPVDLPDENPPLSNTPEEPPVNLPDENPPLSGTPEEPPVNLPDENPPLSETPEESKQPEEPVETDKPSEPSKPADQVNPDVPGEDHTDLPDEPVPEGDQPPKTGETVSAACWTALLLTSAAGMAYLVVRRKKENS